jgi:uncharacterized protein
MENLLAVVPPPPRTMPSFYRTSAGGEIDLVLEMPGKHGLWAIEIKRGLSPSPGKGFIIARADLKPKRKARERGHTQGICLSAFARSLLTH